MKLRLQIQLLRFFLVLLNGLFLALGLSVAGCGLWVLLDTRTFMTLISSAELQTVSVGVVALGSAAGVVALLGCLGADREKKLLLLTYLCLLLVLVLAQVFLIVLLLINRDQIEESLRGAVDQVVRQYRGTSAEDRVLDGVQRQGRCCGWAGPSDWWNNSYLQSLHPTVPALLPCSCLSLREDTNSSSGGSGVPGVSPWCSDVAQGNSSFHQGCAEKLSDWLQVNTVTMVALGVGLLLTQVLQWAVALKFYGAIGRKGGGGPPGAQPEPAALTGPAHLPAT